MTKKTLLGFSVATTLILFGAGCGTQNTYTQTNVDNNTTSSVPVTTTTNTSASTTPVPSPVPWAIKACGADQVMRLKETQSLTPDGKFKGVPISEIAKNYLALSSSKADALTAVTSLNDRQLVVAYVSCDGATDQDAKGFTLNGMVSHLVVFTTSDAASGRHVASLPVFAGSNFEAMFLPVGFVATTSDVLVKGQITGMGAGGSCATTYWMTLNADTAASTTFSTDPVLLVYAKNTHIVYVSPGPCGSTPENIRIKDVVTGSDQVLKKLNGDNYVSLQGVKEKDIVGAQPQFILNYTIHDSLSSTSTPATLVLP